MSTTILSRLPHFTFHQDEVAEESEYPINVTYYNGSIELEQNGNEIILQPDHVRSLMRAILKNRADAEKMLEKH